ncbi:MAG: hypothetical protein WDA16_07585 [Candidatus Thermoplasmatota archaeon]
MPWSETWLSLWSRASPYVAKLAVWRGYERDLQSLMIYAVGIAVYTALIFAFYQNLSKQSAFTFKHRSGFWGGVLRGIEATLLFPLMSFLYFGLLAVSLFILAKSQTTYQIMLIAMSIVVGVRVTAYVSEYASVDLAKTLPLGLLGVLLVDPSYATLSNMWAHVWEVPSLVPILLRFCLLFIVLEGVLRLGRSVVHRITARRSRTRGVPVTEPLAAEIVEQ